MPKKGKAKGLNKRTYRYVRNYFEPNVKPEDIRTIDTIAEKFQGMPQELEKLEDIKRINAAVDGVWYDESPKHKLGTTKEVGYVLNKRTYRYMYIAK